MSHLILHSYYVERTRQTLVASISKLLTILFTATPPYIVNGSGQEKLSKFVLLWGNLPETLDTILHNPQMIHVLTIPQRASQMLGSTQRNFVEYISRIMSQEQGDIPRDASGIKFHLESLQKYKLPVQNIIASLFSFAIFLKASSMEFSVFEGIPQDWAIFDNFSFLIKFI